MKKIYVVVMVVMSLITLFSLAFAKIQRDAEAAQNRAMAEKAKSKENAKRAKKLEQRSIELAVQVREAENKARLSAEEAEESRRLLMRCQNK